MGGKSSCCQGGHLTPEQRDKMSKNVNVEQLSKETGFDINQLERLFGHFLKMDTGGKGHLTYHDLQKWTDKKNPLQERVLLAFLGDREEMDKERVKEKRRLNFGTYVQHMAVFRKDDGKGRLSKTDAKINFLFDVYDENGHGYLTSESFKHPIDQVLLKKTAVDEEKARVAQAIMDEITSDQDGGKVKRANFVRKSNRDDIDSRMSINFST